MQGLFLFLIIIRASLDYFAETRLFGANPASYIAIAFIGILILEFVLSSKKISRKRGYSKYYGFYLICLLPSVVVSSSVSNSFEELLKYLSLYSCIYLTIRYSKKDFDFIMKLIRAILYSAIIPIIYGFYQMIMHDGLYDKEVGGLRINSVFTHPNQYAIFLVVIITTSLLILFGKVQPQRKSDRKFAIVILIGATVNLLMTYSRTCWIWIGIVVIGIVINNLQSKYMLGIGIALIVLAYFASDVVVTRFLDISQQGPRSSLGIRDAIIVRMLPSALQKPIFGHGLGIFDMWSIQFMGIRIQAHNEYFKTLFESGFVGLGGLIAYLARTLLAEIRVGIKKNYILVYFVIGFIAACYFTNTLSSLVGQIYLVSLLASMSVLNSESESQKSSN